MMLSDNLSTRMTAILLAGLAVMLMIGAALLVWPQGQGEGGVRFYQLPRPSEALAIVEAVEASPPTARPKVVKALDTGVIRTTLETDFPLLPLRARAADTSDVGYQAYRQALGGRDMRIDIRRGGQLREGALPGRHALRLSVRLADGEVLVLRRRAPGDGAAVLQPGLAGRRRPAGRHPADAGPGRAPDHPAGQPAG
jgi:two-component system osmolarity sensor histidine kinase EnvZ